MNLSLCKESRGVITNNFLAEARNTPLQWCELHIHYTIIMNITAIILSTVRFDEKVLPLIPVETAV